MNFFNFNFNSLPYFSTVLVSINNFIYTSFRLNQFSWDLLKFSNILAWFKYWFRLPLHYLSNEDNDSLSTSKPKPISYDLASEEGKKLTSTHNVDNDRKSIRRVGKSDSLKDNQKLSLSAQWTQYNTVDYPESTSTLPVDNSSTRNNKNNPVKNLESEEYYFSPSTLGVNIRTPVAPSSYYPSEENLHPAPLNIPGGSQYVGPPTPRPNGLSTPSDLSNLTPLFGPKDGMSLHVQDTQIQEFVPTGYRHIADNMNRLSIGETEFSERRHRVRRAVALHHANNENVLPPMPLELDLKKSKHGSFKLGFTRDGLDSVEKVYVKYHDLTKRKLMWNLWEKNRDKYVTYPEFKVNFDPKSSILKTNLKQTKSDISKEIQGLLTSNKPFGTNPIDIPEFPKIRVTDTQKNLNRINASKYNPTNLEDPKIKPKGLRYRNKEK